MSTLGHRYSPIHFALFRILFGGVLCFEFLRFVPFAGELFGPNGPCPTYLAGPVPNPLVVMDETWELQALFWVAAALSAGLMVGFLRRTGSLLLVSVWLSLLGRTVYVTVPSDGYS